MVAKHKFAATILFLFSTIIFLFAIYFFGQQKTTLKTKAEVTQNTIGYLGCRNTWLSVAGYHNVTGNLNLFWPVYDTSGQSVEELSSSQSAQWTSFQKRIDTYGQPLAVWVQLCASPDKQITYEQVQKLLKNLRKLTPSSIFYISPINSYESASSITTPTTGAISGPPNITPPNTTPALTPPCPLGSLRPCVITPSTANSSNQPVPISTLASGFGQLICDKLGANGEGYTNSVTFAKQAVADDFGLRGPSLGPLTAETTEQQDHCVPNQSGMLHLGKQLVNFFDRLQSIPTLTPVPTGIPTSRRNPFGVALAKTLSDVNKRVSVAQTLGGKYYRITALIANGKVSYTDDPVLFQNAGLRIVLNIRNYNVAPSDTVPEVFPDNLDTYKTTVGQIIDTVRPALVVVGNEVALPQNFSGTPDQYGQELAAVCEISRSKKTPCATDGMLSGSVVLYTYQYLVDHNEATRGAIFRDKAFDPDQKKLTAKDIKTRVDQNLTPYIDVYKSVKPDFVNIHWYVPSARSLGEAANVFKIATGGLPVITNEYGQTDDDPTVTSCLMSRMARMHMSYAVEQSVDSSRGPRSLVNPDGSLRATGTAFKNFIVSVFGGPTPTPINVQCDDGPNPTPPISITRVPTPSGQPTCKPGGLPCIISPTITNNPPTPTGEVLNGNATVTFKLSFQGIITQPPSQYSNLLVKITLSGGGLTSDQVASGEANLISDTKGVWSGSVSFTNIPLSGNYAILVKGPKHMQKKICDAAPTETAPGTYHCSDGKISIIASSQTFDFSGIRLLVGDLPAQDGVIDAYDIAFIRNNLHSVEPTVLSIGDINLDGILDSQDFSLLIQSLNVKYDEE